MVAADRLAAQMIHHAPRRADVKEMGFEEASPIQSKAIPVAMTGADVICKTVFSPFYSCIASAHIKAHA